MAATVFSLFSKLLGNKEEEEITESEERIIYLLKKAKLSIMKSEMDEAEEILHQALYLAQESDSKRGIIYTYDLMANLAFLRGQLDNSEKLFKAAMTYMLDGGVKQDDNSFIEISLKSACIYAEQNKNELAVAGYQFCILSLKEKIEREDGMLDLPAEEKSNTRLLLGLCLDSYGRYLMSIAQFAEAQGMYEKALQICKEEQGELHPQVNKESNQCNAEPSLYGFHNEACDYVSQAFELAKKTDHPDQHVVLSNLAMILMEKGADHLAAAEKNLKEALKIAEEKKDFASIKYTQEELFELDRRKKRS
ncbi:tetratricopeptide repeat protein 19, mitochondrial-like [Spea bombifrons]|uniref:tetratricopeptide repeat protein 19, mitochondrial-like n=1 Tax=Spea bombifrons TaxID=233779 RepID=UPI00234A0A3E|nr:tetratricopeptide repeat protein 19, mitochondrial-like [Spea bombifrons]